MLSLNARILSNHIGKLGKELSFVGHSLGGGLASANALATGNTAITFNAAALSPLTKDFLSLNMKADITANIVRGEVLDYLQQKYLNIRAEGRIKTIEANYYSIGPIHDYNFLLQRTYNHTIGRTIQLIKRK